MFQTLIRPSSGACDYLLRCVGWLEACWCYVGGIVCWWCGVRVQAEPLLWFSLSETCWAVDNKASVRVVVQPALGYHTTNSQSRYITPTRLKSAQYSLHNNAPSSRKLLKMDVLTSETCWAVNWHNKASIIKLVYLYSNIEIQMFLWTPECIWRSGGVVPLILSLDGIRRRVVTFMTQPLLSSSPGNRLRYTINGRLVGPWACLGALERNLLHLQGVEPGFLCCPARSLIIPTQLSRIL